MLEDVLAVRFEQDMTSIARHSFQQENKANEELSNARLGEFLDDAGVYFNDQARLNQIIKAGRNEVRTLGDANGLPAEAVESRQEEFETAVHRSVIDRYLAQHDMKTAAEYYRNNKERIDGTVHSLSLIHISEPTRPY